MGQTPVISGYYKGGKATTNYGTKFQREKTHMKEYLTELKHTLEVTGMSDEAKQQIQQIIVSHLTYTYVLYIYNFVLTQILLTIYVHPGGNLPWFLYLAQSN